MKKFLSCIALCAMVALVAACSSMPANTVDMDKLGARIERAIASRPHVVAPAPAPASPRYERTDTVTVVKGEQLPDGSTSDTTTKRLVVIGDLRFGINDPLLRDPGEPLLRIRGPNRAQPPFFTPPPDTRSMTPEEVERHTSRSDYIPPKEYGEYCR